MKIFTKKNELTQVLSELKKCGKSIGFVPTMGALHEGHLSLMKKAKEQNDILVVSIFVNPTQFDNSHDLNNYPVTIEHDKKMLLCEGCDFAFIPEVDEMYPEKDTRIFDFEGLDKVMEGKFRTGHFNGVAQIVSKLFDVVIPHRAYFGEKDFQQLAIVRKMCEILNYDIQIVGCPIVRENDGLAMSSRNRRLSVEQRKQALQIHKSLKASSQFAGIIPFSQFKEIVIKRINIEDELKVEYFSIVDSKTLQEALNWTDFSELTACIAVFAGNVRLIDNMPIKILK